MGLNGTKCSEGIPFRSAEVRLAILREHLELILTAADAPGHETLIDPDDIREALKASEDRVVVPTKKEN